jgi:DNA-directed RNA polymerase subunit F
MIKERTAITMNETMEILEKSEQTDKVKAVSQFLERFMKKDAKKAKKLKEDIEALGIIRLRPSDIIKIVDTLPENTIELNKIFGETNLDTDEANKILDTIKSK